MIYILTVTIKSSLTVINCDFIFNRYALITILYIITQFINGRDYSILLYDSVM